MAWRATGEKAQTPPCRSLVVQLFNGGPDRGGGDDRPQHGRYESCLEEAGFRIETINPNQSPWNLGPRHHNAFRGLDPLRALRVLLLRRDAAIICAHAESALIVLLLRRLFRLRARVVVWELQWSASWRFRVIVNRLAIRRADCSVVFGSNQIELARERFDPGAPLVCIPFCIDLDFFRAQACPDETPSEIFSCGFDDGRDFPLLLEACHGLGLPVLIKTGGKLPLDPVGHATVRQNFERLSYPDFRRLYARARIVVVTTHATENASGVTALMEAMAMGRPTIVTDNPALRDYFAPPDALRIVPVGDAAALRAAILDLWRHPEEAEAMGRRARAFAERHFHPRLHFQRVADLYKSLLPPPSAGVARPRGALENPG